MGFGASVHSGNGHYWVEPGKVTRYGVDYINVHYFLFLMFCLFVRREWKIHDFSAEQVCFDRLSLFCLSNTYSFIIVAIFPTG